jgi:hypothetical protein
MVRRCLLDVSDEEARKACEAVVMEELRGDE